MTDVTKAVQDVLPTIDFAKKSYHLALETSFGTINLEFYPDVAPGHSANMIALAKIGFYDNLIFHRIIPGFVIQGGCPEGIGIGGPGFNIDAEFNSRLHHPGTLSMARAADPNSAGSQFFLCLNDLPSLDNQYTVFGGTSDDDSLAIVKKIGSVATGPQDKPVEDVTIIKATVTEQDK